MEALAARVGALRERAPKLDDAALDRLASEASPLLDDPASDDALEALVALGLDPEARAGLRARLRERATAMFADAPALVDRLYLASMELDRYPATTVSAGALRYVLVADKGEMGVRAVREAAALGLVRPWSSTAGRTTPRRCRSGSRASSAASRSASWAASASRTRATSRSPSACSRPSAPASGIRA